MLALSIPAAAGEVKLAIEELTAPEFSLRGIAVKLATGEPAQLTLDIDSITVRGSVWRGARVECARIKLTTHAVVCGEGRLRLEGDEVPLAFAYDMRSRVLEATLTPAAGERWRLDARMGGPAPQIEITVDGGRLARLERWLPAGLPRVTAGTVSGTARLQGTEVAGGDLVVEGVTFSDSSGLHAGEGVSAVLRIDAEHAHQGWRWRATGEWRAGEVFWQPVYLKANKQLYDLDGEISDAQVIVKRGRVTVPGIGAIGFTDLAWDRVAGRLDAGRVDAQQLPLAEIYEQWLKPFFAGTALADLRAGGEASVSVEVREGELRTLSVELAQASAEDKQRRFALFGVSGSIPWRHDADTTAELRLQGGEVYKVPFGAFQLPLRMRGTRFALERAEIPLLGGMLTVGKFSAARVNTGWQWQFSGELALISVDRLTQSLGLPTMHGTLSGAIPRVSYGQSILSVGGALVFNVFAGTVTVRDLVLSEPLGRAPRLTADLEMRKLDLDLLTRTFSFGSMTGLVDATVTGLELVNWQPVKFDARIESSPGDYRRSISQAAVQNISALGGAGAAAAIQRSFLRFFDRFGYQRLGLSCMLRDGVCSMDGIEPAAEGSGYVIVKGGGIPALSVMGYNRKVSWTELIVRLKRIMQENVKAVIE